MLSEKATALSEALDGALASDSGGALNAAQINRLSVAAMRTGADELA